MKFKNLKGSATQKQKDFMRKLEINFSADISKQEASIKISEEIEYIKACDRAYDTDLCSMGAMDNTDLDDPLAEAFQEVGYW